MSALWGALIGGGISLVTTLAVDVARSRREMRHRWDASGLEAIEHFVDIANRTIGALYDEGRARSLHGEQQSVADAARQARSHMDSFRVAHARARLTMPVLAQELMAYDTALRALKTHADEGFADGDARWKELQTDLNSALDRLMEAAIAALQLRSR
jgi:leucyl aminopeptidase (aminopeptidase T)